MKDAIIYDDTCGFCMWTLSQIPNTITDQYEYIGFSELSPELKEVLPPHYERSFHVIERVPDAMRVHSAGDGLQYLFAGEPMNLRYNIMVSPVMDVLCDTGYRVVAQNRDELGRIFSATEPK